MSIVKCNDSGVLVLSETNMRLILYIFILLKIVFGDENACLKQDFGHSSFVCVCNSTYCDTYGKIERKF